MKLSNLLILIFLTSTAFAKNINYAKSDVHTLTLKKGEIELFGTFLKMNDQIDIFNIKQQEIGSIGKYDAIGDLTGYLLGFRYGFSDSLMLSYSRTHQKIGYSSDNIFNNRDNIYLRYNIFQDPLSFFNSGITLDVGFERNKLDDFYLTDIQTINSLINKILPNEKAEIRYSDGQTAFENEPDPREKGYYTYFNNTTTKLSQDPYIVLKDTKDDSFYLRLITGFYTNKSLTDFYIGFKKTKIKNLITTTEEIKRLALDEGYDVEKNLDRYETMAFFGINYSLNYGKFIYEFNYEYEKFFRDKELNYIDYNHIINASISYAITNNFLINIGGKFMYRQLNGQIPYLYNKYTQTSYDHKYGYATFGLQYAF